MKNRYVFLLVVMVVFYQSTFAQQTVNSGLSSSEKTTSKDSLEEIKSYKFDGADGPHILNNKLYKVNSKNQLSIEKNFNSDSLIVEVSNKAKDEFEVCLQSKYSVSKSTYELPDKMIVVSDIEGKFNAFSSFLIANKVIDENYNWIFENGRLVLVGDFVDRGKNVTQVLWLIYKLEYQALEQGGQVHFILGNHEVLNFQGDYRYNQPKYIRIAQEISGKKEEKSAIKYMYSDRLELGKWLATKNVIEKIGNYLFVHAGLSPETLGYEMTLDEINANVRSRFRKERTKEDKIGNFLFGSKSPFWYRGLVMERPNYEKITMEQLDQLLEHYEASKIVIGHTIVGDISSAFDSKVIMIDVPHNYAKFSGKTKGLLIVDGLEYVLNDLGERRLLTD